MNTQEYMVPDIFAPKRIKDSDEFAKGVARYALRSTQSYRTMMATKYKNNREVFSGQQSLAYLRDILQVEENATYLNIKFTPRPVVKKIIRLIVSGYLKDEEAVDVVALSKHIEDRKNRKILSARFRMDNFDAIKEMSEQAGLPLISPDEFVPDTEEDLELHTQMNDKELEETLMQETLTYILNCSDIENLKNLAIRELCINNLFGMYESVTDSGRPKIEGIYAEDAIVPTSFYDNFIDAPFLGRFIRMNVSDIRARFHIPSHKEAEFFKYLKLSQGSSFSQNYGNYNSSWTFANERPYDKEMVIVTHLWWKCTKTKEYAKGIKEDVETFEYWDYPGYTPNDKVSQYKTLDLGHKTSPTAYEGYFLHGGDFVLEWGEQKNIPYDEIAEEIRSPFTFHMPENSGSMKGDSMVHMIKDSVEIMDLVILKIKMLIAKMAPDGYAIDIDSLMDVDLGTGGILNPLQISEIHRQTGDIYYRGKDEDGNENQIPIRSVGSGFNEKLSGLLSVYNFEQENIRNYLGINEFRDGTANKSRTAAAFAQTQLDQSNMATEFIYRGWTKLMSYTVKNQGLRVWYNLKFGDKSKGLLKFLGKYNTQFLKSQEDLMQTAYNFEYKVVMTKEERMQLEQTIASAITEGTLTTEDAIKIRTIKSAQVAHKYLTLMAKKKRKERMEEAQANQQSAAEYAAQSGVKVEQAKQETAKMAADMEMAKETTRGENTINTEMTKGALAIILQYAQSGTAVPEEYQPLVNFVMEVSTAKLAKSAKVNEREMQQMAQQEHAEQVEAELSQAVESGEITPEQMEAALGI